ncbi:MAG: MFS transporter, partial [Bacteroidota bacterium]
KAEKEEPKKFIKKEGLPPLKNALFLLFFIIMALNSISFVQYFSAVPLFYSEVHGLSEDIIGLLFLVNGGMIVIFEMPLIAWLERLKLSKSMATFWGIALLAVSLIILNLSDWFGVLVIGMFLMTLGEMIGSPFASSLALDMAPKGRKGSYMGLFSISFSISHIIGHNASLNSIDALGYSKTWLLLFLSLAFAGLLTLYLKAKLKSSKDYETY